MVDSGRSGAAAVGVPHCGLFLAGSTDLEYGGGWRSAAPMQRAGLFSVGACRRVCAILSCSSIVSSVRVGAVPLVGATPVAMGVAASKLVSTKVGD